MYPCSYMCAFSEFVGDTNNMCLLHKNTTSLSDASYCGSQMYPYATGYPN